MAIQYYMRGYNIGAPGAVGYVDWVVNDTPDSLATYVPAPYNSGNITHITVNKTVTSKVDNFLKPFESLTAIGGTGYDGYFFHLNSYDWLHATPPGPPIPIPSYLTGLSVVRGTLNGIVPRDYATLFWAESALKWLFAYNTNGDGQTIGETLPVGMGSLSIDGYVEIGTNPAQSGIIRIPNNQFIVSRNATNSGDGYLIGLDDVNRIRLGRSSDSYQTYIPTNLRVDGYVRDGGNSALSSFIRNSNNTSIVAFRNAANSNDITALASTSGNLIVLGDAVNAGIRFNTATGFEHIFQVNSTNLFRVGNIGGITYTNFENTAPNPIVSQFDATIGNGQNLIFKAQTTSSVGGIGGSTIISSGHGLNADGYVDLRIDNVPKIRIFGTTVPTTADFPDNSGSNPSSIQVISPTVRFYSSVVAPNIIQDQTNLGVNAQPMFIKAQRANAATRIGGDLRLSSGGGNAVAENAPTASHSLDGYVRLQTGTVDRLFIDATANRVTQTLSIFSFNGLDGTFDAASVINPIIRQRNDNTNSITGQLMTIQAQNATGTNTIGGSLNITSGQGTAIGSESNGYIRLQTGGTTRLLLDGYNTQATLTLKHFSFNNDIINPIIRQIEDSTASLTGQTLTIQAQNAIGTTTIGGNLILQSGLGTTVVLPDSLVDAPYSRHGRIFFEAGNITNNIGEFGVDGYGPYFSVGGAGPLLGPAAVDGYFRVPNNTWALSAARNPAAPPNASIHLIGTDSNNRIVIGDVNDVTHVPGTLLIGTFESSNDLLVEDRIIHANFNEAVAGPPVPPPVLITGLTVHRGDDGALAYNDEAGWIWVEGVNINASDGFWKAASVADGDDTNLATSLNIMSRSLTVTDDPNIVTGFPTTGGLRTLNNSIAVSSRNFNNTLDLRLLRTDGDDRIIHGSSSDKGHIFDTAADGYYDFRVNSIPSVNIDGYKLSFKAGRRRHITPVSSTYNVLVTDDFLAVDSTSIYTITLPASPELGDTYEFKDINGTASINNVTILGNGNNIDGLPDLVINTNFAALVVTYTGSQWSIS